MDLRILIADDEQSLAQSLKKSFLANGIKADLAFDGVEALSMLDSFNYDLLLLDWRMPKMTGLEVCKHLRTNENKTPIILLTALEEISNKIEALNHGADDYITKPFSFDEVLARIRAILRRSNIVENKLHFDIYEINLLNHSMQTEKGELRFTEKEFEVLHYMVKNKNEIIDKEQFAKEVWQLNFYPTTNYIEATIKNLRKKLEEYTGKKYIKTIYGEGYTFIEK